MLTKERAKVALFQGKWWIIGTGIVYTRVCDIRNIMKEIFINPELGLF
jgi:hypothetical protein